MAPEIIAQSAAPHSNHFNQIEFLHSTGVGTFTIQWQRIDAKHQLLIFKKNGQEYARRDRSVSQNVNC